MILKNSYVILKISNQNNNHVIKDFNNNNIPVTIINKKYKVKLSDYYRIKELFPYYEIKIVQYTGLIYFMNLLKTYYLAIIGLIISITIVYLSSFIIVDIDIKTNDKEFLSLVKNALRNENIEPFTIKKSYDQIQKIKKDIKDKYENDIDWIEITNIGMKYIVNVEKRIKNNIVNKPNYCNVYANKKGMIKRIKTFQGVSLVSMNDYVQKGDLLISGEIKNDDEVVNHVCADGIVYAEVWYIVNIKVPLEYIEKIKTNNYRNNIVIEYKDNDYSLFKDRLSNYQSTKELIWEIMGLKIYKRKDYEIKKINKKLTYEEAINHAKTISYNKVKMTLDEDERIIKQKVLQKHLIDSTINIDIFIIAEEKIGYSNVEG